MSTANPNWSKWIFASVCQHFRGTLLGVDLFIEGERRATSDLQSFCELRIDGPDLTEVSRNEFRAYMEINVLIQQAIGNDLYALRAVAGEVQAAFTDIPIFKYGSGVGDDGSSVGCLQLIQKEPRERIAFRYFGRIKPDVPLEQATVEGHYEMSLSN